jgi:catechol 2,3-dioxygenase-like lactoylglutathione lyase family enzyme
MLDHVSLQVADLAASAAFYDQVLAPLGGRAHVRLDDSVGYGTDRPNFWIGRQSSTAPNKEVHVAFVATDRDTVVAFHQAAVAVGAEVLHEPRIFPEYHPNYFGAFVRDPDGNNVEAVCHRPAGGQEP